MWRCSRGLLAASASKGTSVSLGATQHLVRARRDREKGSDVTDNQLGATTMTTRRRSSSRHNPGALVPSQQRQQRVKEVVHEAAAAASAEAADLAFRGRGGVFRSTGAEEMAEIRRKPLQQTAAYRGARNVVPFHPRRGSRGGGDEQPLTYREEQEFEGAHAALREGLRHPPTNSFTDRVAQEAEDAADEIALAGVAEAAASTSFSSDLMPSALPTRQEAPRDDAVAARRLARVAARAARPAPVGADELATGCTERADPFTPRVRGFAMLHRSDTQVRLVRRGRGGSRGSEACLGDDGREGDGAPLLSSSPSSSVSDNVLVSSPRWLELATHIQLHPLSPADRAELLNHLRRVRGLPPIQSEALPTMAEIRRFLSTCEAPAVTDCLSDAEKAERKRRFGVDAGFVFVLYTENISSGRALSQIALRFGVGVDLNANLYTNIKKEEHGATLAWLPAHRITRANLLSVNVLRFPGNVVLQISSISEMSLKAWHHLSAVMRPFEMETILLLRGVESSTEQLRMRLAAATAAAEDGDVVRSSSPAHLEESRSVGGSSNGGASLARPAPTALMLNYLPDAANHRSARAALRGLYKTAALSYLLDDPQRPSREVSEFVRHQGLPNAAALLRVVGHDSVKRRLLQRFMDGVQDITLRQQQQQRVGAAEAFAKRAAAMEDLWREAFHVIPVHVRRRIGVLTRHRAWNLMVSHRVRTVGQGVVAVGDLVVARPSEFCASSPRRRRGESFPHSHVRLVQSEQDAASCNPADVVMPLPVRMPGQTSVPGFAAFCGENEGNSFSAYKEVLEEDGLLELVCEGGERLWPNDDPLCLQPKGLRLASAPDGAAAVVYLPVFIPPSAFTDVAFHIVEEPPSSARLTLTMSGDLERVWAREDRDVDEQPGTPWWEEICKELAAQRRVISVLSEGTTTTTTTTAVADGPSSVPVPPPHDTTTATVVARDPLDGSFSIKPSAALISGSEMIDESTRKVVALHVPQGSITSIFPLLHEHFALGDRSEGTAAAAATTSRARGGSSSRSSNNYKYDSASVLRLSGRIHFSMHHRRALLNIGAKRFFDRTSARPDCWVCHGRDHTAAADCAVHQARVARRRELDARKKIETIIATRREELQELAAATRHAALLAAGKESGPVSLTTASAAEEGEQHDIKHRAMLGDDKRLALLPPALSFELPHRLAQRLLVESPDLLQLQDLHSSSSSSSGGGGDSDAHQCALIAALAPIGRDGELDEFVELVAMEAAAMGAERAVVHDNTTVMQEAGASAGERGCAPAEEQQQEEDEMSMMNALASKLLPLDVVRRELLTGRFIISEINQVRMTGVNDVKEALRSSSATPEDDDDGGAVIVSIAAYGYTRAVRALEREEAQEAAVAAGDTQQAPHNLDVKVGRVSQPEPLTISVYMPRNGESAASLGVALNGQTLELLGAKPNTAFANALFSISTTNVNTADRADQLPLHIREMMANMSVPLERRLSGSRLKLESVNGERVRCIADVVKKARKAYGSNKGGSSAAAAATATARGVSVVLHFIAMAE